MGATGKFAYTVMGDSVNLASRLEGTNKEYRTRIMVSRRTYELVEQKILGRELDRITVKGRTEPVTTYELIATRDRPLILTMERFLALYAEGMECSPTVAGRTRGRSLKKHSRSSLTIIRPSFISCRTQKYEIAAPGRERQHRDNGAQIALRGYELPHVTDSPPQPFQKSHLYRRTSPPHRSSHPSSAQPPHTPSLPHREGSFAGCPRLTASPSRKNNMGAPAA